MTAANPAMRIQADLDGQPLWTLAITKLGHPDNDADPAVDDLRRYRVEHRDAAGASTVVDVDHRRSDGSEILAALALIAAIDPPQPAAQGAPQ